MKKVMLLLTSIALVLVTSIAFSALSTSLAITSEVKFRPLADIRVNAIALNSATGAQIAYESDFSKNTVSSGFTLPSEGSSISYRVRVDNSGDVDYSIYDILKTSSDNGLNVAVSGYNITDVIPAKTSVDLILTYTTSNPSESVINVVNTMDFRKVYHVVYETGTSETIPAQVKYEGIDLTLTNTQPVKNGYTFSKWNTKSDGTGVNYNSGATYGLDEDKTLYARYNLDTYNINYVLNGGTNDANNPNTYTYETPNITLADATKTGYEFKGWTGNGTTTATKNLVLPTGSYGDKTFTAQFADETPPTIDVTNSTGATSYLTTGYNVNAGYDDSTANVTVYINAQDTGSGVSKIEYVYSSNINVPTTGWIETTNGELTVNKGRGGYYLHVRATDGENNTTTVTTKKISVRFRVAYYDDYSKNTNITQSQYFVGTALTTRTPTAVSGYTFDGWYRDTALTTKVVDANTSYIPTTSIRLYGKWIPVNYNITYAMNNGTNSPNNPNSYTIESNNITLEQPTKILTFKGNPNATSGANATSGTVTIGSDTTAAQTFKGWSGTDLTGDNNVLVTITSGSTGDRDYEAHWTAVAGTLPTVTKTGYTCGWSTTSDGTTIEYTSGGLYPTSAISEGQAATVNLYAVCNPNTYTLTINPNGGTYNSTTSTSTKTMTYDSSNNNDIGVPTRDGYTFDGWYLAVDDKTNQLFDDTGKNTDLAGYFSEAYSSGVWKRDGTATVYAHWSKVISSLTNSITPTSYIYDGTAKTPTPTVIDGSTTLTSGTDYTITYTNNTNVGTATATITGANVYNSTTKSYYTGTTTISFEINNAKLTFNVGTCTNTTGTTVLYTRKNATKVYTGIKNSTEGTIPTASKTGYTFEGWYTANSGGSKVLNANGTFTGTAVTNYTTSNAWNTVADQVLYARCTPTTYTVTANANGGTIASTTGWSGTGNTSTKTVTYDAAYGTLPTVTKTGYTLNGWTLLPEGYRQVEYIQSTGTQYIDTNIVPTNTLDVRIHYIDTAANNSNYVLGSRRNTGSTVMYAVSGQANTQSISSTFVGESIVYPITRAKNKEYIVTNIVEYDEDDGYRIYGILNNITDSVTYDGYTAYSQSGITGDPATIKVFGYNSGNIHKGMKLYSLKMWDDGDLVRDFIPCVNESTGKAGLYDLVNGVFHGNQASSGVDFTVGNDNYITSSTIVETSKNHNIYAHWTINDPSTPTITGGETKVYGANATTLTCTENTTYASGTTKSYSFGYANSNGETPSNWTTYTTSNTLSVGAEAYVGQRWYSCKVKASDGTQTTSEVVSAAASDAEVTINNAKITFDANSCGTISGTSPAYVKKGTTGVLTTIRGTTAGTIASVSKSGYTFDGWYDGNTKVVNGDGSIVASAANWTNSSSEWLITVDKTLTASCTINNYEIAYAMNNGINNVNNPNSYTVEDSITLQAPTKTLTFKGNPNATSGANATSGTVTIGSDTTAAQTFAGWTGSNGNTPQTNVTIASGSTGNKEYTAHWTAVAGTLPTVTKTGYTCGWSTTSDGTTIEYTSGGLYPTSAISEGQAATVNLYAVCNPNTYTLTINPNGGTYNSTTSNSSKTMTYDASTNNDIGVPTRDGYTFDGWYTEADGGTKLFGSNGRNVAVTGYWSAAYSSGVWKKTAAVTVYAHWIKNVVDLTNSISPESYIYSGTAKCPTATVTDGNETLTNGADYTVACSSNTNVGTATLTITGANAYNSTTKAYYTGTATINFAINNAKLTFNKGTCSTPSSNTILYTKKGSTVVYTGIQNTVEGTIPTPSKTGYTFDGWYTSNSGGSKVLTSSNAFTGTAVTNYTTASAWNTTTNRTLYARCIANTHTLTINPQGGTYSGSTENAIKTMTYNSTDNNDIGVPTRDGYTFGGWYTEENGGTQLYGTNGQNVSANGYWNAAYSTGKWVKDSDVTVYAKWTKDLAHETITVTKSTDFIYNGNAQGPTVTVTDGEASLASGTFTLSGNSNTNVGLYTITVTGANTYNSSTMAYYTGTNSVDYAINNAKISFNKGDCTAVNGTTPRYTRKGSTVVYTGQRNSTLATIPTGTPDTGSSFQGWYTANNGGGSKVLTSTNEFTGTAVTNYTTASAWDLTANKTLYAHCTPDDHTITYDCTTNGGSGTIAGGTANYGDTIDLTKTCTAPSGYTFQGWNTTADTHETLSSLTMGLDSVTLRAIYKKNAAFTATFAANNGATVSPTTASCYLYNNETSCQVTPGTVTVQSGFGHYGFNTASNATAAKDVETNNSNYDKTTNKLSISDSGTWYPITRSTSQYVGTFTVVDTNAATKSGGSPSCYRFNGKESCDITAPALTAKSGYVVLGWSATNGSATAEYASSATITLLGNANFYSVTYYNTVVTITFNRNTTNSKVTRQKPYGGSWSTDATVTSSCNKYNGSTTCNMTSPEVEVLTGYHIVGYNTSASATTSSWNVNTAKDVSSNTTYYAVTAGNSYSIKFNSNCPTTASGTMSNLSMIYGTAKNLTANAFSCTGRVFDGWSLNADGTGTAYADEESVSNLTTTNGAIVNLYAKWRYTPPTPTISGGASKIYGVSATTLTCTENTSYPSGVTKYYSFGYTTSSTGTPSDWSDVSTSNTKTISADAYVGVRYYSCRVYVSDGDEVSDTTVSSNNTTMTLKNATITFDANGCGTIASGGTSPGYVNTSMTGIYSGLTNTTAGVMPSTNKLGYTFTGWYAESGLTTKVVNGDGSINASVANWTGADKKWLLTSDNTLYASCSRDTYTITYALNNGTNNANNPSTYHVESSAITIQAPTKTLTFKGNYNTTSGANAANGSGVTIGSNTTKAQTFAGWTGTGLNANTNPVTIPTASTGNRTYTAHWTGVTGATPTVTRTGYTCGWNTSSSGTTRQMESGANYNGTITEGMSATVNLYAVCTPKQYTVNYLCGSGTTGNPPASATATYDQSFTVSTTAGSCDKSGYSFAGWEDPTGGNWTNWSGTWEFDNGQYSVTNNTLTLTAKWAQKSSVITLNNGNQIYGLGDRGNTVSENMTYSINNGIITVTANTTDGFGFTNGEVYLEANKTYTFNCNTNGTWGGNGSDTVEAYLMLNKQYNTYYHMDSNNNYQFTPTVSGKYALRLDVNQSGATHTFSNISIVQNNNANSTTKTMTYDANTNNDIGVPTRAGFTFQGWYTAPIGGTQLYGSNGRNVAANGYWSAAYSSGVWKHDGDLTVYAHWAPKTYTVSYSCGTGATGTAPSSATAVYGETFTIATGHGTCAKANGYSFDGWKDPTGGNWTNWSGRWEFENGQFSVSNNALSLQARWTGGTEKVIFNYNQNQTYGKWSMMDTYYKPDWSKSFDVDITFNPSTSGARYMLFGNYDKSDTKAIQMEVTSSNKFELWVGSSSGHGNSINASVSIGSSNTLHFAWNASTKVATVVINGVSYNFTENTLTGTSARNLRIGNLDYREGDSSTYPFQNNITITDFKISEYFTSPLTSAIPVPDPAGHYKIFDGWTGNNGNNPQYSKGVPAGTDTTVTYNANWHTGFGSIVCYASSGYETSSNQYIKYWYRPCVVYVDKARRLAYLQSAVYFYRTNDYQTNGNGSITVSINGTSYGQQSITNDQIIKMGTIANNEYVILWKHAWDNRTNSLDAISYDANSGKADYRITQFYHSQFSISTPTTAYSFTLPSLD